MKTPYQKRKLERKGLSVLPFHIAAHHQKKLGQELKQSRNLETGADAEAVEGRCWLACFTGLLSLLSYRTWDHQARGGTALNALGSPQSMTN